MRHCFAGIIGANPTLRNFAPKKREEKQTYLRCFLIVGDEKRDHEKGSDDAGSRIFKQWKGLTGLEGGRGGKTYGDDYEGKRKKP